MTTLPAAISATRSRRYRQDIIQDERGNDRFYGDGGDGALLYYAGGTGEAQALLIGILSDVSYLRPASVNILINA